MARFINQVCEKKIVPQETANRRVNLHVSSIMHVKCYDIVTVVPCQAQAKV